MRTHLRIFGVCMSNGFVWLSVEGNNLPTGTMLSGGDNAIAAQKLLHLFEQCSYSVQLDLSKSILFMYDQVTNLLSR